jgi:hypothetical protein
MTTRSTIIIIFLITVLSDCTNDKSKNKEASEQEKKPVSSIEIHLEPAFDNYSSIIIDKSSNTIQFNVDTTIKFYRQENPTHFSMNLDSFRINTAIDSFYSQSFLDSIASNPEKYIVIRDGLSIYTVLKRGNSSDTINSDNFYPKILSENIISQITYISKNTTDKAMKKYIKTLQEYFH